MKRLTTHLLAALTLACTLQGAALAASSMFTEGNALVLKCEYKKEKKTVTLFNPHYQLKKCNAPGYAYFPGEAVNLTCLFHRDGGADKQDYVLEIQGVHTRIPKKSKIYIDPYGFTDVFSLDGKPVQHKVSVTFAEKKKWAEVEFKNVPVPDRYSTYCLVLVKKEEEKTRRILLGSVVRVPPRRPDGTVENTPIFGERLYPVQSRIGIRGLRLEISMRNHDGEYDWTEYDKVVKQVKEMGQQVMFTLGGVGTKFYDMEVKGFHPIPAAVPPTWNKSPYGGQCDWGCGLKHMDTYEAWVVEFCKRYWEGGKGALWGLENFNEPWEGGGLSGYARDCLTYNEWQKRMARAAGSVDEKIRICASSSIMNTEDKFYSTGPDPDGTYEMDEYVDVFTDHYVPPYNAYGPMVAEAHGKFSIENETWLVISEYRLPQIMCQWLATGQRLVMPFHPSVLSEMTQAGVRCPTTVCVATAAFNYFVTGLRFKRLAFHDHLPWLFQFGEDNDPKGVCVLLGQLITRGGPTPQDSPKGRLWAQVDAVDGGTIEIDNADGALQFFDGSGNEFHQGEKKVTLPLNLLPAYVRSAKGPALVAERVRKGVIKDKYPAEILPRDFTRRVTDKEVTLEVDVANRLNRPITGTLTVKAPAGFALKGNNPKVTLAAGEKKRLSFSFTKVKKDPANQYPFAFTFATDAGTCKYDEVLNATVAVKTTPTIDGDLKDWQNVPGIVMVGEQKGIDPDELARKPWLRLHKEAPGNALLAEVKLAWDENNLYVAAQVRDTTPQENKVRMEGRDEDAYFHSAASDQEEPWKSWLAEAAPGESFAQVPYIYKKKPYDNSYTGDQLQLAFDTTPGWHDLKPVTDVPEGFHVVPDTDYEFSAYLCADGKSELWNLLGPGIPRIHDWPHQPKGKVTTNPTPGSKHVVRQNKDTRTYEIAIPKAAMKELLLKAGTTFDFTFYIGNNKGPKIEYGKNKAVTKLNGLTLRPYWSPSSSCDVTWALVE